MKDKIINNIKTIRESKDYTEAYMAEKLGMTQGAYNRKENGDLEFNLTELVKMGEILEVPPSKFIDMDLAKMIQQTNNYHDTATGNPYITNDEGYKAALEQYKLETAFLRAQVEKLTHALAGRK
jgi:transcriptional regulator with XRE-family HTH domain